MRKPTGLGKRSKPIEEEDEETPANIYFPYEEDKNEVEQVGLMLAHAEVHLDEAERCIPLLRAVVHECDRIGRLKESLESEESIEGVEEDMLDKLRNLHLDDQFYRTFGDALYRLSMLEGINEEEEEKERLCIVELVEAAIDRYNVGLELFPTSTILCFSLQRALLLLAVQEDNSNWTEHGDALFSLLGQQIVRTPALLSLTELFETITPFVDISSLLLQLEMEWTDDDMKEMPLLIRRLRGLYCLAEGYFDDDELEEFQKHLLKAKTLLDSVNLAGLETDDPEMHKAILPVIAQYHIWMGCLRDTLDDTMKSDKSGKSGKSGNIEGTTIVNDDSNVSSIVNDDSNVSSIANDDPNVSSIVNDDSNVSSIVNDDSNVSSTVNDDPNVSTVNEYEKAIEIWKLLKEKYQIDIPDHIIELEQSL